MFYVTENRYARVWEINIADNRSYATVKISTTRKNKDSDEKYYSNWTAKVFNSNVDKIEKVKSGNSIIIKKCSIQNELYTDKNGVKKTWLEVCIYDFDIADDNQQTQPSQISLEPQNNVITPVESDDEMPF